MIGKPGRRITKDKAHEHVAGYACYNDGSHGFADLVSFASIFTTLEAGDVLVTGTPGGVGFKRNPPVFLGPGDVVEVEVSRIGVLRNGVECEVAGTQELVARTGTRSFGRSG